MPTTQAEDVFNLLQKMRMDLTQLQARITDLSQMLSAMNLPAQPKVSCTECGLEFGAQSLLDEHRYQMHDGPEPPHWQEPGQPALLDVNALAEATGDGRLPAPEERRRIAAELRARFAAQADSWVAEEVEATG